MKSAILVAAAKIIVPLQLGFSVFVLLRGHNAPGGGFVGGLIASSAVALVLITHGARRARSRMVLGPAGFTLWGLGLALASGIPAVATGQPFMTARWAFAVPVPLLGKVMLGTPLLFDGGVYMVIVGISTAMVLALAEEET